MADVRNMLEKEPENMEFTMRARRSVEAVTLDPYFRDSDPELILDALLNGIRSVSFADYLKRTIRRKRADDPDAGADTEDVDWLVGAFRKRNTPPSFTPTSAKLRALVKNWLTQRTVSRNVVLLLGFALELSPGEVDELLTKGLREPRLDPKDPLEVICWYCFMRRLPFAKFEELWGRFSSACSEREDGIALASTVRVRGSMESIRSEAELTAYLDRLGMTQGPGRQSISARRQFDRLYQRARELVANVKTEMEREDAGTEAGRYAEMLSGNDRMYDYQKMERIRKKREAYRVYRPQEITPADIENVLYAAVPKDRNGNMIPMKDSSLNLRFSGKRLNRQHMQEILDGSGPISRFDLITLAFFASSGETDLYDEPAERYGSFIRSANETLRNADMEPLYPANPFESFVMMCMLTDDPLGSFADVWELSYDAEERE